MSVASPLPSAPKTTPTDLHARFSAIALAVALPADTVLYLLLPMFAAQFGVSIAEAGILLATTRDGAPLELEGDVASRFVTHRAAVNDRQRRFLDVVAEEQLTLDVGGLHYFAHWITPEGSPRRYDTRFFVAAAPARQTAAHDAGEVVADEWVTPADALRRHREGDIELIFPTIRNLQAISRFETVAELIDAAKRAASVPAIMPRITITERGVRILLPGDEGYDEAFVEGRTPAGPADFNEAVRLISHAANPGDGEAATPEAT